MEIAKGLLIKNLRGVDAEFEALKRRELFMRMKLFVYDILCLVPGYMD